MKTDFSGILLINKPKGMTSHDVVGKVRRLYNTREVGHTGTLDPMATGLLVVLVGRAVKASELIVSDGKTYRAGLRLGITTDTEDVTGEVLTESDAIPSYEEVARVSAGFVGDIKQVPPMYSALKVGGVKLVDLARKGTTVEREARDITVYSLELSRGESERDYLFTASCSKGTYIRTLCADIGRALGCGGVMSSLERLKSGMFTLDQAYTLAQLEGMELADRIAILHPVESVFADLEALRLPAFYEKLAKNGCEIYQKKLKCDYPLGKRFRMVDAEGFYAIGEIRDYPDGSAVKLIKRFRD